MQVRFSLFTEKGFRSRDPKTAGKNQRQKTDPIWAMNKQGDSSRKKTNFRAYSSITRVTTQNKKA